MVASVNGAELLRFVEMISRERGIEKSEVVSAIEQAMIVALRKRVENPDTLTVTVDPNNGQITAKEVDLDGVTHDVKLSDMGRIAAQTFKQIFVQKNREAERDNIYEKYIGLRRDIRSGTIQRMEGPNYVVNLGDAEAFFPRKEQVPTESYNVGERVRGLILDVRKQGQKVKIILSRTHPEFVKKLFELEVPEVAERIIEIKAIVREPGYRSKVAVASYDPKVDAVGACVGVRGSRIKGIIDELNNEKIDIIRWNESAEVLITNALKPARVDSITLDYDNRRARVVVPDDQLSLSIGKRGQNVRLAARLCKWDLDIVTVTQEQDWRKRTLEKFRTIPGVDELLSEALFNSGFDSFGDILAAGPEALLKVPGISIDSAAQIIQYVMEHPEPPEQIADVVHADGAQRRPDNTFVEPGQEVYEGEEEEEAAAQAAATAGKPATAGPADPFARAAEYAAQAPKHEVDERGRPKL
ncbi:MAG: transcription termination/antitermination protein NusA [Planctomycetes bacterium]|jgi:N utilization substance protein A|nr:transcription termination/antitermination protein NusA [Planctomycetota bacterium]